MFNPNNEIKITQSLVLPTHHDSPVYVKMVSLFNETAPEYSSIVSLGFSLKGLPELFIQTADAELAHLLVNHFYHLHVGGMVAPGEYTLEEIDLKPHSCNSKITISEVPLRIMSPLTDLLCGIGSGELAEAVKYLHLVGALEIKTSPLIGTVHRTAIPSGTGIVELH